MPKDADEPPPGTSDARRTVPHLLSTPPQPLSALALLGLGIALLVCAAGAAVFSPGLSTAERVGLAVAGIAAAALYAGFSAVIRFAAEAAHWSRHTAELLYRADRRTK